MTEEQQSSPHSGTVIDAKEAIFDKIFRENQQLREKNYELEQTLAHFEKLAQEREEQQKKFELVEENILKSDGDLYSLLERLSQLMAEAFAIPMVSITLIENQPDLPTTVLPLFGGAAPVFIPPDEPVAGLNFISAADYQRLFPYHRPLVTRQPEDLLRKFFPAEHSQEPGSTAFIPLIRREQAIGLLNMASPDPDKFIPGTATDAVESLGRKLAIVIENTLLTAKLERMLRTDQLTGLLNRRTLDEILPLEFTRAQRYRQPLSLVMIDLDDFKPVNDTYGHPAGDRVLAAVGRLIRDNLRRHDFGLRYGGDEFTLILPSTNQRQAREVIDKLTRLAAATEIEVAPGTCVTIQMSAGLATHSEPELNKQESDSENNPEYDDYEALKVAADQDLYRVKKQRKN